MSTANFYTQKHFDLWACDDAQFESYLCPHCNYTDEGEHTDFDTWMEYDAETGTYVCPICIDFEKTICAYWENRLDLFVFACDVLHWDYETVTWTDTSTLECFNYWDLCDDILEEELLEEVCA